MSASLIVVAEGIGPVHYPADLDPNCPGADYGNLIPRVASFLDKLAADLGVHSVSFFHYADPDLLRETMEFLEGKPKERMQNILLTQKQWHDPADGLATFDALIHYLEQLSPEEAKDKHPQLFFGSTMEPLVWDLRAVRYVLAGLSSRFHFEAM